MRVVVVIPLFNKRDYVAAAIKSVLSQTHSDLELIVVNDGSTDGSAEVARAFTDCRVRVVDMPNGGVSAARNRGVSETDAEWVAFLDADDTWHPRFLELLLKAITAAPEAVVVGTSYHGRFGEATGTVPLRVLDMFESSLSRGFPLLHASAVLCRRSALVDCGGFPEGVSYLEDQDTFSRLAWTGAVAYVPSCLSAYNHAVPCSLSKLRLPAGPANPCIVSTYRRWRRAGKIPRDLQPASRRFVALCALNYLIVLVKNGGRRGTALRKLAGLYWLCLCEPQRLIDAIAVVLPRRGSRVTAAIAFRATTLLARLTGFAHL